MDKLTPQQRHANMAAIHGKDTKPEMVVRRYLWKRGFRYRLNYKRLPGHPDLVLRKYRTCIFVNGCFWHGHGVTESPVQGSGFMVLEESSKQVRAQGSECCKIPKTNREFWITKIRRNKERDSKVQQELATMGWHSITIWECELKPSKREDTLRSLAYTLNKIFLQDRSVKRYETPEEELMMAAEETPEYKMSGDR